MYSIVLDYIDDDDLLSPSAKRHKAEEAAEACT
jgi:hypothetical protein